MLPAEDHDTMTLGKKYFPYFLLHRKAPNDVFSTKEAVES